MGAEIYSRHQCQTGGKIVETTVLGLPFTHKPQYHNKGSSIVYQGVADTHVLHGSIALP